MKREIIFRGKGQGHWYYGYLYEECGNTYIIDNRNAMDGLARNCPHKVDENTIGQYTGLKDKKGNEVYEGDLIRNTPREVTFRVEYINKYGGWWCKRVDMEGDREPLYLLLDSNNYEVIGNIYDNPELLKD